MKKRVIAIALTAGLAFGLAACGSSSSAPAASAPAAPATTEQKADNGDAEYVLKMHITVGTTDPVYESAEIFADLVSEKTNGAVAFELYPSSQLGVTQDCLEGLSMRACDIVYDSVGNLSTWTDLANIEATPYMYSSVDHFKAVWEGEVGDTLRNAIGESAGLKVMGCGLQGIRVLTSNKPVTKVADCQGLKIRVPTIDIYMDTWQTLGASPTAIAASEIFTSMQQNTVDAQENAYPTCVGLSLHECCKYVTETNHVYNTTVFVMDPNFFGSLPEEYQTAIEESAMEAGKQCTDLIVANNEKAKQTFVDAGVEIIDDVDITEWQDALSGMLAEKYPQLVEYRDMILAADPN